MFRQSLNTWTFYLLFVACAITFSDGASLPNAQNEPHTMYEAIVSKCPQLENTKLKENSDIFTKQCVDWAKINPLNLQYNKTRMDSSCLVLYESLLSFCTQLGDHVVKFDGIIPTAPYLKDYTIERVCFNNETRNSLMKTEHNISNLLTPSSCVYLCGEFAETGLVLQSDVCKYAYYFATFNVSKFLAASNLLHKNDENSSINEPQSANKTSTNNMLNNNQTVAQEGKDREETKPHNEDQLQVGKPQQTVNDEQGQNEVPVHSPEQPADNNPNLIESKKEDTQVDSVKVAESVDIPKSEHPLEKPDNSDIENAGISKPKPGAVPPANANVESLEPNKAPKESKNQASEPEPAVEESPLEGSDDKVQDNISEGEDQEQFMEDEAEEANAAKAEPVMPEETEQKTPSKKAKPNTVEDEAISSYNTPDDDMDGDSYFFSYFTVITCLFIVGYVGYHNRQKILALLLEGQKGKRCGRQSRRPNSANYHKLDSNLEEAISSSCTKNASNVIY